MLFVLFAAASAAAAAFAVATKFIHNGFFTALHCSPLPTTLRLPPPSTGYIVYINFAFLRKLKFIMAQHSNL